MGEIDDLYKKEEENQGDLQDEEMDEDEEVTNISKGDSDKSGIPKESEGNNVDSNMNLSSKDEDLEKQNPTITGEDAIDLTSNGNGDANLEPQSESLGDKEFEPIYDE